MSGTAILGWKLDRQQREALLARFPPHYADPVADHVTFKPDDTPLPLLERARIVGRVDDGAGVEAMVVALNGSTERPDGGTWHITWSLGEGRRAKESNEAIARLGWEAIDGPDLVLEPARWERPAGQAPAQPGVELGSGSLPNQTKA